MPIPTPANTLFFLCDLQAVFPLGPLDPAIDFNHLGNLHLGTFDKTTFSMVTPEIQTILLARPHIQNIILFGIEAHICVLQTAIALCQPTFRKEPYTPYVIADCLASHNAWEVPIVLQRLAQEGALVSTTESIGFQLVGDSKHPKFKAFSALTKETKEGTARAGAVLVAGKKLEQEVPSPQVKTSL
ncbi:hypothetical protein C0991_009672 [Blastosporella zonata]|nr:hypothetical protein C0991_009672 [Blastosporella zonata]